MMLKFSIIIPTYNRPDKLNICLNSIAQLNYPVDQFEVVVVDDGSIEPLEVITDKFKQQLNLIYFKQENTGPAGARNKGVEIASNQYLIFTDDDCEMDKDFLQAIANIFQKYPEAILGGHTINSLKDNIYSQTSQDLINYLYQYYNSNYQKSQFFTSNNLALPTDIFKQIKGFDTTFPLAAAEDRDFCDRLFALDYPMIYVPEAIIYHQHFLTFKKFWRQHFNYGKGAKHFHQIKAQRKSKKIKVESIDFYYQLLTYPWKSNSELKNKVQGMYLIFVSQVANTAGFFTG